MSLNLKCGRNERKNFFTLSVGLLFCVRLSAIFLKNKKEQKAFATNCTLYCKKKEKGDCLAYFHISHAIKLFVLLICLQKRIVLFPPLGARFLAQCKTSVSVEIGSRSDSDSCRCHFVLYTPHYIQDIVSPYHLHVTLRLISHKRIVCMSIILHRTITLL